MASPVTAIQQAPITNPKIAVNGLRQEYRDPAGRPIVALDGVDFAVGEGEFICLLGPSGCGKSTLLRLLAGLERPTSGSIAIDHHDSARPAQAMVFQGPSLFPWRTVLDNVAYGLEIGPGHTALSRPEREGIARQRIAQVGLARFADAYPHQLSEGMRQRANLARALAVDPAIILMDEPFGNLDEQNRLLMQGELLQIWHGSGRPVTIVFVTHSIDEAIVLADRIVIFTPRPGQIDTILPVSLPRPRDAVALRGDSTYADLYAACWDRLRDGVLSARAAELAATRP